jgi:osmotically-inducible protein OsmY
MKLLNHVNRLTVTVFLATATIIGVSGCAGDRYHESTGEHIDDPATTSRVKSALGADDMYKYPDVKVSTFKGTVQLSGFVDHHDQKTKAGEIAKGVDGVKDVVNNITVK